MKNSLELKVLALKDELESFDDKMDKYEYIIDYGDRLPELSVEFRDNKHRVLGCQSELWIRGSGTKKLKFEAFSEAKMVRGLAAMVLDIYNDRTAEEILETDPKILNNLGIDGLLTPGRQNGIGNLIAKIYEIANKRTSN